MNVTPNLAQLQQDHVVLERECIDRLYLNAYVPQLTSPGGVAAFCRGYLGHRFASTKQAVAMTKTFLKAIDAFLQREGLERVRFKKGQRKDDVMQQRLRRFDKPEGVVFVGVAQEKVCVPRTTRKRCDSGGTIPWIIYSNAMVNGYYFTINHTYDFRVGRRLKNLPALRQIGFPANRRVLEVERLTHDSHIGSQAFAQLQQPAEVDGQHASALPFGQERVQALLLVLVLFCLQPEGFRSRQARPLLAQLLGLPQTQITPGRMTYDLRRLRLHGLIERIPKTHRYRLSPFGLKTALFYSRVYQRLLRPGLSELLDPRLGVSSSLATAFNRFQEALDAYADKKLAA